MCRRQTSSPAPELDPKGLNPKSLADLIQCENFALIAVAAFSGPVFEEESYSPNL